jgi:hypothetical protein
MELSLVDCPTTSSGVGRDLATRVRTCATSCTCAMPPARPSTSELVRVWMLSTTTRSGSCSSTCRSTAPRSCSSATSRPAASAPVRRARTAICSRTPRRRRTGRSGGGAARPAARPAPRPWTPGTTRPPAPSANRWATSSSSVDLPTPGSPASSTTWPGTSPPPTTRSNSPSPVAVRAVRSSSTSLSRRAGRSVPVPRDRGPGASPSPAGTCSTVPQPWHCGQRPTQRGCSAPHAVHPKTARLVRGEATGPP